MSAIRKDQMETASKFMTMFWKEIVKPYYNPEQTEAWWNDFIEKMKVFNDLYCHDDKRLTKMMAGFYNGLHEVYKDERKE